MESGQQVAEGDLLVTLNDDVEQADLVSLEAQEDLARSNFDRIDRMWKKKTISETEFDNARSNLQVAQANLVQIQARLAKKTIRAPFAGVLGIRNVSKGQYADIYLVLDQPTERLVVPSTSIVFSSFGASVFIVKQNDEGQPVAQRIQILTCEQRGDQVEILEGLQGDEQVVQAGTSKLRNNTPVVVNQLARL